MARCFNLNITALQGEFKRIIQQIGNSLSYKLPIASYRKPRLNVYLEKTFFILGLIFI